ncbi:MAG: hypothetical protein ACRESS_12565 [Stenotrophobium sp.]
MKRTLIIAALSLGMALPGISEAHGFHGGGHGGYGHGDGDGLARAAIFPLVLGAAVVGAVASIVTAPLYAVSEAPPPPPPPPQRVYYAPPQQVYSYGYAPAPYGYYPPQPVCTYYPNGARYCQ